MWELILPIFADIIFVFIGYNMGLVQMFTCPKWILNLEAKSIQKIKIVVSVSEAGVIDVSF